LTISYQLHPPIEASQRSHISPTATHAFHLKPLAECKDQKEYYRELSAALIGAKDRVGLELTAWKEAAGNAEQPKMAARAKTDEDSEEALSSGEDP